MQTCVLLGPGGQGAGLGIPGTTNFSLSTYLLFSLLRVSLGSRPGEAWVCVVVPGQGS